MIALTHPGKIGDLLFSFPAAITLASIYGPVDFYTSQYCKPLVTLLEYQSWIENVIIPENYVIDNFGMGVQPWLMPVADGYEHVFDLGLQTWPTKNMIDYYANQVEVDPAEFVVECPDELEDFWIDDDCILIASCLRTNPLYAQAIADWANNRVQVVHVGGGLGNQLVNNVSNTKFSDFLATATTMKEAAIYAGGVGANSVLASAFTNLKVVITHPEKAFDTRFIVYRDHVTFMTDPPVEEYVQKVEELWLGL